MKIQSINVDFLAAVGRVLVKFNAYLRIQGYKLTAQLSGFQNLYHLFECGYSYNLVCHRAKKFCLLIVLIVV